MKLTSQWMNQFSELTLRDRVLVTAVVCALLVLGGNFVLMRPLQLEIDRVRAIERTHTDQIAVVTKELVNLDNQIAKGVDPLEKELAIRDEMLRKIAEGNAFLAQHDATSGQVGLLARSLLDETPGVSMVSFKNLPGQVFYTPPAPPPPPKATEKAVESLTGVAKVVALEFKSAPPPPEPEAKPVALQKTIYKHGVEITVKGSHMQLLSYLEKLQAFPKRVFWSEAKVSVSPYPVSVLRIVIFTLSDQAEASLN